MPPITAAGPPTQTAGRPLSRSPLDAASIISRLDEYLEVEFTFIRTEELTAVLAGMPRESQDFILEWTRRAAATNTELAFQFANRAKEALLEVEQEVVSAWCLHAMDSYDNAGLQSAMAVIRDLDAFLAVGYQRAAASVFEEAVPILIPFVQGLEGRRLKIEPGDSAWTDGETIHLPGMVARLDNQADNFQLFKSPPNSYLPILSTELKRWDMFELLWVTPDHKTSYKRLIAIDITVLLKCSKV